jgi:hypothetical protein
VAFAGLVASEGGRLPPLSRNVNLFKRIESWTLVPDATDDDPEPAGITADVGFVLFDGQGAIDAERSGAGAFELVHRAELELLVQGPVAGTVFDAVLERIGDLVEANRVSGLWDFLDLDVPDRDLPPDESHDIGKGCTLPVVFTFRSTQPF